MCIFSALPVGPQQLLCEVPAMWNLSGWFSADCTQTIRDHYRAVNCCCLGLLPHLALPAGPAEVLDSHSPTKVKDWRVKPSLFWPKETFPGGIWGTAQSVTLATRNEALGFSSSRWRVCRHLQAPENSFQHANNLHPNFPGTVGTWVQRLSPCSALCFCGSAGIGSH